MRPVLVLEVGYVSCSGLMLSGLMLSDLMLDRGSYRAVTLFGEWPQCYASLTLRVPNT